MATGLPSIGVAKNVLCGTHDTPGPLAGERTPLIHRGEPIGWVLRSKPRDHWLAVLEKVGVPCAPVNDIAELAASEQLRAVDLMRTLPRSGAPVVGLPISFDRQRPQPQGDSPKLGEHNAEVFGSLHGEPVEP